MSDTQKDSIRTPLARARGLGSAKDGTMHWWFQRVTALALLPLTLWFMFQVPHMVDGLTEDAYVRFLFWIGEPVNSVLISLFLICSFWHTSLGLQVIIEDYVHAECAKLSLLLLTKFACFGLAALCIYNTLVLSLGR